MQYLYSYNHEVATTDAEKANESFPIDIETTCDDDNQFQLSPTLSASVEATQSTETSMQQLNACPVTL